MSSGIFTVEPGYRPVLDNRRLKEEFGYLPRKTSAEVFAFWWAARQARGRP